jgi:flagellar hook-associated protein 2
MSSPITFSGFDSIDFIPILDAIMTAERAPMTALETRRTALDTQGTAYTSLAGRLAALESAVATTVTLTSNTIPITSWTNTLAAAQTQLDGFVTAHNELMSFLAEQNTAAATDKTSIARDSMVRSLRGGLREALQAEHPGAGADYSRLSTIGIELEQTGTIRLDRTILTTALTASATSVRTLVEQAFGAVKALVESYASSGGLIQSAKNRLSDQIMEIDSRLDSMQLQLDLRRGALQQEFIAADLLMTQLKGQGTSLEALGGQYRLF